MFRRSLPTKLFWNSIEVVSDHPTLRVVSRLTFSNVTEPHNLQTKPTCAYVGILNCAQLMQRLNADLRHKHQKTPQEIVDEFETHGDIPANAIVRDQEGNIQGVNPLNFADFLFTGAQPLLVDNTIDNFKGVNSLTSLRGESLIRRTLEIFPRLHLGVYPHLPMSEARHGRFVKLSRDEFVEDLATQYKMDIWMNQNSSLSPDEKRIQVTNQFGAERRNWHTQCIVGYAAEEGSDDLYFVCLQSWQNSLLTFVPMMTAQEVRTHYLLHPTGSRKRYRVPFLYEESLPQHNVIFPKTLKADFHPTLDRFTMANFAPPVYSAFYPIPSPVTGVASYSNVK